ncbi:DUF6093 family protein [Nocardioides sp. Arc9.136]|uniref:DUF6093 family protein n=1 Tax=Nocardioides sp. Arc9.136 TaxID=2996826 RepID=UPI0026664F2F|nr:DUF6093 family protein [Nocardioides sp. Arc9.136]WKN47146.1 DUF6093 family protein [Nocardioides sp. Arc9.136]
MPRPRHAQGRPATPVIPTDWAATHAPVVAKTWTATVELRRPGGTSDWNPTTEQNELTPHPPYYAAACSIQAEATQAREATAAEDATVVAGYLLTVPVTADAHVDDLATVTGTGDTLLEGRTLTVRDVVRGSQLVERDLFCTLND